MPLYFGVACSRIRFLTWPKCNEEYEDNCLGEMGWPWSYLFEYPSCSRSFVLRRDSSSYLAVCGRILWIGLPGWLIYGAILGFAYSSGWVLFSLRILGSSIYMGLLRGELLYGTFPECRSLVEGGLLRKRELTRLKPLQVVILLSFRKELLLPLKRLELSEMTPNWPESNPWSFPVLREQITFPLSY